MTTSPTTCGGPERRESTASAMIAAPAWGYRWALELRREGGSVLGQTPLALDLDPVHEWLRLLALRHGVPDHGPLAVVEPIWHESFGAPYLRGFRARLGGKSGAIAHEFSNLYFGDAARAASESFVARGELERGETFRYVPVALADATPPPPAPPERFAVEAISAPTHLLDGELGQRLAAAEFMAAGAHDGGAASSGAGAGDAAAATTAMPVFVPQLVLDEARTLARSADAIETGGILIGHLRRDATVPEAFVEVTALVAAPHTVATATRVTFTADTWAAVRGTLALRGRHERMVGWLHSHPADAWCRECPLESQRRCPLGNGFFSPEDRLLHRTMFPAAWTVGLLVTRRAFGKEILTMFGWHEGVLSPRGFHVLESATAAWGVRDA